jgi:hypothetical protein
LPHKPLDIAAEVALNVRSPYRAISPVMRFARQYQPEDDEDFSASDELTRPEPLEEARR